MTKRKKAEAERLTEEALAENEGLSLSEEAIQEEPIIPEYIPPPPIEPYKKIKYLGTVDIFKIKGPMTGIEYKFTAQERISFVATEDYDALLNRVRPARRCCGGKTIPAQPYFGPVD